MGTIELAMHHGVTAPAQHDDASILVVSDNRIIRAGLHAALAASGVRCRSTSLAGLDGPSLRGRDYVLVWASGGGSLDPYPAIDAVRALGSLTTLVPVLAVTEASPSDLIRLRFAESGVRYTMPHRWLADHLDDLPLRLSRAELPSRFHLETPFALRQRLGLELSGDLAVLLEAALAIPPEVWTGHLPQSHLPIGRQEVLRLRRIALEGAGVPAPDFSKYAAQARRPPELPEWREVRSLVRRAFELPE